MTYRWSHRDNGAFPSRPSSILVKAQVLLSRHDAKGVGVTHTTSPSLYTNYSVTLGQDTKLDGTHDTPLETTVDILLPWAGLEVGLLLREVEWPDATVKVRVLDIQVSLDLQVG